MSDLRSNRRIMVYCEGIETEAPSLKPEIAQVFISQGDVFEVAFKESGGTVYRHLKSSLLIKAPDRWFDQVQKEMRQG